MEASTFGDKWAAYRVSEVARLVGVEDRTVRMWIQLGQLPAARCGRTFSIPRTALEALLSLPPGWPGTGLYL